MFVVQGFRGKPGAPGVQGPVGKNVCNNSPSYKFLVQDLILNSSASCFATRFFFFYREIPEVGESLANLEILE